MSVSHKTEKKTKQWVHLETANEFVNVWIKQTQDAWTLFTRSGIQDEGPGDLCVKNFIDQTEAKLYMKNQIKKTIDKGYSVKEASENYGEFSSPKRFSKYSSAYRHKTPRVFMNNLTAGSNERSQKKKLLATDDKDVLEKRRLSFSEEGENISGDEKLGDEVPKKSDGSVNRRKNLKLESVAKQGAQGNGLKANSILLNSNTKSGGLKENSNRKQKIQTADSKKGLAIGIQINTMIANSAAKSKDDLVSGLIKNSEEAQVGKSGDREISNLAPKKLDFEESNGDDRMQLETMLRLEPETISIENSNTKKDAPVSLSKKGSEGSKLMNMQELLSTPNKPKFSNSKNLTNTKGKTPKRKATLETDFNNLTQSGVEILEVDNGSYMLGNLVEDLTIEKIVNLEEDDSETPEKEKFTPKSSSARTRSPKALKSILKGKNSSQKKSVSVKETSTPLNPQNQLNPITTELLSLVPSPQPTPSKISTPTSKVPLENFRTHKSENLNLDDLSLTLPYPSSTLNPYLSSGKPKRSATKVNCNSELVNSGKFSINTVEIGISDEFEGNFEVKEVNLTVSATKSGLGGNEVNIEICADQNIEGGVTVSYFSDRKKEE